MSIERIDPGPRKSQAVVRNDTVYLAGQVAPGPTIEDQTRAALDIIDGLLQRVGSDRTKLLTTTIYLADMANFDGMNAVWEKWIDPANAPARTTVEAKVASPEFLVEFSVVAAI